jgi:hypothetical protein
MTFVGGLSTEQFWIIISIIFIIGVGSYFIGFCCHAMCVKNKAEEQKRDMVTKASSAKDNLYPSLSAPLSSGHSSGQPALPIDSSSHLYQQSQYVPLSYEPLPVNVSEQ